MQPRWPIRLLVLAGDASALLAALELARLWWLRSTGTPFDQGFPLFELLLPNPHMPAALVLMAFWWVALQVEGLYDPLRMISSVRITQALFRAFLTVMVGAILVQYFTGEREYSRLLLLGWLTFGMALLGAWRLLFFRAQRLVPGLLPRQGVLVVGVGEDARLLAERLARFGSHVYQLAGFVTPEREEQPVVSGPVVGRLDELGRIADERGASLVIVASREVGRDEAMTLTRTCTNLGLDVLQVPFTWGLASVRVEPAAVGELDLVRLGGLSYGGAAEQVKRAFDIVAVLIGGALLLPLLLVVALAVKLQDGGPVLYASPRAGRGGRRFLFYKFRSMVPDADKQRGQLPNEADGRLFKLKDDPRITPLGRFLRRWSIDEFPQLLNVLKGDMNLVGPRPLPIEDLKGIEADPEGAFWFEQRSRVNPGITGLWQVAGRSDLSFRRMVELDVYYIQHWSLILDLQILVRTIPAVLRGRGAR